MDGFIRCYCPIGFIKEHHIVSTVEFKINFLSAAFEGDTLQELAKLKTKENA